MATKIISEDLVYYIKVDTKKRRLQHEQQQQFSLYSPSSPPLNTTKIMTTKELAHAWLALQDEIHVNTEILAAIARLKRQLAFSIDTFVNELNLTYMPTPQLASVLMAYHSYSREAHGMMPLISLLLPLISRDLSEYPPSGDLTRCFHELKNTRLVQDYLEVIITYMTGPSTTVDKSAVQRWLDSLFEQYRLTLAHYSFSSANIASLDLYLAYFDLLMDTRRLKCLSWQERRSWLEKEWLTWTSLVENRNCDQLQIWMEDKSDTLLNHAMMDLEIDLLLQNNIAWLSEIDDTNKIVPTSSSIFNRLIDWYTKSKVPNMRLIFGIFGKHCAMLVETGQDSIEIIKILEEAQQLIIQYLHGATDMIALLMSMIQITLHHMESLLSYTQWFQTNFTNSSSTFLKSKQQYHSWMKHMETMIPYEATAILQIHAKALTDSRGLLISSNYVSLVKAKLLALGVDATLRQYPARLDTPLIPDLLNQPRSSSISIRSSSSSKSELGGNNRTTGLAPTDLQHLIDKYGETKSISSALWEDSIFRPKWFKQTFLHALMIEWKPTDSVTLARRDHMVKSFQRKGKVPSSLLVQYEQSQK